MRLVTRIKVLLHAYGIIHKCPYCDNELIESYNYNRCTVCSFGNKYGGVAHDE